MNIGLLQFYSASPAPDYHEMASALRSRGHTVLVATPNADGDLAWSDGISVVATQQGPRVPRGVFARVPGIRRVRGWLSQVGFLLRVRGFLQKSGFDVVQVNPHGNDGLLVLGVSSRTCCVYDVRQAGEVGGVGFVGSWRNLKLRLSMRLNRVLFFDHACFASESAAERLLGRAWAKRATVHRVGQHPSLISFRWGSDQEPAAGRPLRFVYLGTLSRVRRLEKIFEAADRLRRRDRSFLLDFIGPDAAQGFYHRLAGELGLAGHVRLLPPVPYGDVAKVLGAYDAGLAYVPRVPDWNCQPTLKVLEFRALGLPVIATDNLPNRAVITDGVNGLLIDDSAPAIERAMERWIDDRSFFRQCRVNARNMRQGRTWADSAREYEEQVYRQSARFRNRGIRRLFRSSRTAGVSPSHN